MESGRCECCAAPDEWRYTMIMNRNFSRRSLLGFMGGAVAIASLPVGAIAATPSPAQLFATETGKGRNVMLLHGWTANGEDWSWQLPVLEACMGLHLGTAMPTSLKIEESRPLIAGKWLSALASSQKGWGRPASRTRPICCCTRRHYPRGLGIGRGAKPLIDKRFPRSSLAALGRKWRSLASRLARQS
jgi:hypothetical protein